VTAPMPRCQATLEHVHGKTHCVRDAFHAEPTDDMFPEPMEYHLGVCPSCDDDGDPDPWLRWTGYREVWGR